jgi:hypothetical protein
MKKIIIILTLIYFTQCNKNVNIVEKYNSTKKYCSVYLDSANYFKQKLQSIYGLDIINPDGTLNSTKRYELDPGFRDEYFIKYEVKMEIYGTWKKDLIELEQQLPDRLKDSIRIIELNTKLKELTESKIDIQIMNRQYELINNEISEIKKKKYK